MAPWWVIPDDRNELDWKNTHDLILNRTHKWAVRAHLLPVLEADQQVLEQALDKLRKTAQFVSGHRFSDAVTGLLWMPFRG
jgi:hypothetical protein